MLPRLLIILALALASCADESNNKTVCYSFDLRSCNADPWDDTESTEAEDSEIRGYLNAQGITVDEIRIDPSFHEVVCLACEVCPEGPRVYIQINSADTSAARKLGLLSYTESSICP